MPSAPPNRAHATATVDRVVALVPRATRIAVGFPESPRPEFRAVCDAFVTVLVDHL